MVSLLLVFHITVATTGMLSGVGAMAFTKGSQKHRTSGKVFAISMMLMGLSAMYLAALKSIMLSVLGGALMVYLVATAWLAVKPQWQKIPFVGLTTLLFSLLIGFGYFYAGMAAAGSESGLSKDGLPPGVFYFFGSISLIAVACDIKRLFAQNNHFAPHIIQHVWRIGFAMFMATASLFLGQSQVFPAALQTIILLMSPVLSVMLFFVFWLIKVSIWRRFNIKMRSRFIRASA